MDLIIGENELTKLRKKNKEINELNETVTYLKTLSKAKRDKMGPQILGKKYNLFFNHPIMGDIYSDLYTNGALIQYPHGRVVNYASKPYFYRGQIKDYGSCQASLYRKQNGFEQNEERMRIFINNLRLEEFNQLLYQFSRVREWPFGDVYTIAIAQHYGFDTNLIDITDDLEVALFFACCKHKGENKYEPLKEEDITGMNEQFGVIFMRDQDADFANGLEDPNRLTVYPIGYQPFTRCHRQRGCFVQSEGEEDLQTSGKFRLYKFRHSSKLSNEIYEKFDGGKSLFSYDELESIRDLIDSIIYASTFSDGAFQKAILKDNQHASESEIKMVLMQQFGIKIGKAPYLLSRQRRRYIDSQWSIDKFCESEKIAPSLRLTHKPM